MKYLFFDIECASCEGGGKLCEFGYVLTDAQLDVVEKDNLLINPDCRFDRYVIQSLLNFCKTDYDRAPLFPARYDKIYALLSDPDTIAVGHTTRCDAEHIGDDCIRYGLAVPQFRFVDIVELYKPLGDTDNATKLVKMCEALDVQISGKAHSADVDAEMTMLVTKALCKRFDCDLATLIKKNKPCLGRLENYERVHRLKRDLRTYRSECTDKHMRLTTKDDLSRIRLYAKSVKPDASAPNNSLKGKKVCVSDLYEIAHYLEILQLVKRIAEVGGEYTTKVKSCDVFVTYEVKLANGDSIYCKRGGEAQQRVEHGKSIEIISLPELLKRLNTDEEQIKKKFKIDFAALEKAFDRTVVYSSGNGSATLGDFFNGLNVAGEGAGKKTDKK